MEKKKLQFFRTVAGKTILFIIINITLLLAFLCTAGAFACVSEDLYSKSASQYFLGRSESNIAYSVNFTAQTLLSGDSEQ